MQLDSSNRLVLTGTQAANPGTFVIDPNAGGILVNGQPFLSLGPGGSPSITGLANIGIGTGNPLSALDVNGGIAVGAYAGATQAPANGLIVSGNVGIGTDTPGTSLAVTGQSQFGVQPPYTPWWQGAVTVWCDQNNINGLAIISSVSGGDGAVVIKPHLQAQYPFSAENIGEICGSYSSLVNVDTLCIQGEGGKVYIGAMQDNGGGAPV
jgi:hypothetical protein